MTIANGRFLPGHRSPPFAAVSAFLLLGCRGSNALLPLSVGDRWDYRFRRGMERDVAPIRVTREVPLEGGKGWELRGPMGVVRLGNVGGRLVADELGGAFLTPPLPIGVPVKTRSLWRGWVVSVAGRQPAKAEIAATEAKLPVEGRLRALNRTVVTMRVGDHTVELQTWYAPGDGIVQQEQRTDDKLDLALERVSGWLEDGVESTGTTGEGMIVPITRGKFDLRTRVATVRGIGLHPRHPSYRLNQFPTT